MIKQAIFGLLLAGSTAAAAQTTTQPATDPLTPTAPTTPPASTTTPSGTAPATPAQPATPADPTSGTPAASASPATPATPAETTAAAPTDTAGIVAADWSKYDTNSNKQLSRTEFTKWVTTLQTASGQKAPTRDYLTGAFRTADADKSGGVSEQELVTFLGS